MRAKRYNCRRRNYHNFVVGRQSRTVSDTEEPVTIESKAENKQHHLVLQSRIVLYFSIRSDFMERVEHIALEAGGELNCL